VLLNSILALVSEEKTVIYSGAYGGKLNQAMLELAIENMWSRKAKRSFFLGIPFTKEHSSFPKHQVLLEEIENQYPGISEDSIYQPKITSEAFVKSREAPAILRRYQNHGPSYSRLSRFYDDTAFFYQQDLRSELVADPFSTLPVMPSATAGFTDQSSSRTSVPSFLAERCTGCGTCFVQCPHAALPPIAIGIEELLKAASGVVTSKNMPVTRITPMIKNMARISTKIIDGQSVNKVANFLPQAFQKVAAQMKLEGDKLEVATNEFMAIMDELGDFPISITETFFHEPETLDQGTGELFSLVIDPAACTGCGVCVAACPEDALELVPEEESNLPDIKRRFDTWEFLPDTSGDTIRRLQHNSEYSSLAAAMLSRNYYMSMTGGDAGQMQSESKKILHVITTLTEAVVQPKILDQIKKIDLFIEALTDNVHKKMSDALPTENLENLSQSLQDLGRRKIRLQDLMQHSDGAMLGRFIDSEDLQRKTDLIKDLKDLRWILEEGPTGVGRARFGIILAGKTLDWASKYPNNHFVQPLFVHRGGSISNEAIALFLAQLRYQLDYIKLIRRAELEAKDQYDPAAHDLGIAELSWSHLVEKEKEFIAPILLVVDQQYVNENGWGELHKLLSENYPIKVILLDDLCLPTDFPVASLSQINSGIISVISLKNAFVFQGSLGHVDHLFDGLMEGLHNLSPALMHIYLANYSEQEGAILNGPAYSQLAIDSRALPLVKYNPKRKREFLRGAIDLSGNKEMNKNWVVEKLELASSEMIEYPQCWADLAFSQQRWKGHFKLLPEASAWEFLPTFLSLDEISRENTQPVIARVGAAGMEYYVVSAEVIRITGAVLDHWRTLQELSGLLYEFPRRLEEEVEKRLTGEFEIKMNETEERYSAKLKEQENAQMQKVKEQLKQRLLTLVEMARNKVQN
jgi:pyruvate-ferredoxin/flavodoxin oxidoreductase